jgi:hypothetical protein
MKKRAVICDIDGTLMDIRIRVESGFPFITREQELGYYNMDVPNKQVVECVKALISYGIEVVFVSGRTDIAYHITSAQIFSCIGTKGFDLHMRRDGDFRKDSIVKQEIYDEYIRDEYEVLFCLDDRNQVVEFWRGIGIPCFQVAEGNF